MRYLKKVLLSHREEFLLSVLLPLCLLIIGAVIDCAMIYFWKETNIANAFVFTAVGVIVLLDFLGFAYFYFGFRLKISFGVTRNEFLFEELIYAIMASVTGFLLLMLALVVDSGLLCMFAGIPFGESSALKDLAPFLLWIFLILLSSCVYLRFVFGSLLLRFSSSLGIFIACIWAFGLFIIRPVLGKGTTLNGMLSALFLLIFLKLVPVLMCIVLLALPVITLSLVKKQGI